MFAPQRPEKGFRVNFYWWRRNSAESIKSQPRFVSRATQGDRKSEREKKD